MKNTKYKLTKETKNYLGRTLHRIEALKDFGVVSKGDKGGWIESEKNLSVSNNAWVFGNAQVFDDAQVFGNAWVYGNAQVFGKLKLKAGFFFGVRWKSDTEIKEVEIKDGDYLVYKGYAEFGEDEPEVEEMTVEQVCKALGKNIKIIK